jgi:hypothetical protein
LVIKMLRDDVADDNNGQTAINFFDYLIVGFG